jgi:succinyl-diaminopimelate desuccinylase
VTPEQQRPAQAEVGLDLDLDVGLLTAQLVDVRSESGEEGPLADAVERALRPVSHLEVERDGHAVVARTDLGRDERVVLAGHLDTVPEAGNLPGRIDGDILHGLGSCDMKGGVAVALKAAATIAQPVRDVTYVFYDCEEVEAERNGIGRISRTHPDWLAGDFAVLLEPSGATVEGGCQGSMRVEVTLRGRRAHSARSWTGENAIHAAGPLLTRLAAYQPRVVDIDGLEYREGLNAVIVRGGVAGNVIPDECVVSVNYRFAPDRSQEQAAAYVREALGDGLEMRVVDSSPGALPGLSHPAARAFVAAIGREPRPKYGWTDVSRFSALGVPAVNYGPGDPNVAHTREERVSLAEVRECEQRIRDWLTG